MERLNQISEKAIIANKWLLIRASRNGPKLSNLGFADDIILFVEAKILEQVEILIQCLHRFCIALGSKINYPKSRVNFCQNMKKDDRCNVSHALVIEATNDLGIDKLSYTC